MLENMAPEEAEVMTVQRSGTTIDAQISGINNIATVAWTSHHASHGRGLKYFMPNPKVPWKILAIRTSVRGRSIPVIGRMFWWFLGLVVFGGISPYSRVPVYVIHGRVSMYILPFIVPYWFRPGIRQTGSIAIKTAHTGCIFKELTLLG
jgi:hypothetical protein